jgi:hypothetical protein
VSRKPIDQQQPSECRQAIWDWIKQHPTKFQIGDIMYDIRLTGSSVKEYLTGLVKAGYLAVIKNPLPGVSAMYDLINDTGNDAPRVRKDGTPVTQGQGQQYMWNAMRILKTFSAYDLAFNASTDDLTVSGQTALTYCRALCKAGYLVARDNNQYMLISSKWTGPHPPQIQRTKQVYDPNLKRVVWSRIEGGAE